MVLSGNECLNFYAYLFRNLQSPIDWRIPFWGPKKNTTDIAEVPLKDLDADVF